MAGGVTAFREFVERCRPDERLVALHDSDADGVTAAVVWQRAFERLGFKSLSRVIPDRFRDAWSEPNRARAAAARPDALFVLDLGSRSEEIVPGVRTCLIDHHRPDGVPPGATLVSGYEWDPIPNTSIMVWDLCSALVDVSDVDWVAAIGAFSDLGDRAPFEVVAQAKKRYSARALKEVTALVNSARRASTYDPECAARVLLEHESPAAIVTSTSPDVATLRAARAEVNVELAQGKKSAPKFAGNVALVKVHSRCQIHPLIAQIWRSRLPSKYVVIVANDGYLPGRVNFSARSAGESNALDLLRSIELPAGEGSYAHGHDHATGGSLSPERFAILLEKLGFG
jgi:single-stranded-DNA-specific exonuclease